MQRRKIRDEQDALECLRAAKESGMERRTWAQGHGIDARSLHAWWVAFERRKKRQQNLAQSSVRFVEVVATPVLSRASYRIHVDEMMVEVGDDFQDATLRRLLSVMQSCSV